MLNAVGFILNHKTWICVTALHLYFNYVWCGRPKVTIYWLHSNLLLLLVSMECLAEFWASKLMLCNLNNKLDKHVYLAYNLSWTDAIHFKVLDTTLNVTAKSIKAINHALEKYFFVSLYSSKLSKNLMNIRHWIIPFILT